MEENTNDLIKLLEKYQTKNWEWGSISSNPNITLEYIIKTIGNPAYKWNWYKLSSNPNITIDFVKQNLDKKWDWYAVSSNPNITWKMIQENKDIPWDLDGVSYNPNITFEIVKENKDFHWNWHELTYNKNISIDTIKDNPSYSWDKTRLYTEYIDYIPKMSRENLNDVPPDGKSIGMFDGLSIGTDKGKYYYLWRSLSSHSDLTWDIVKKDSDKPWFWFYVSANPNITIEIIENNPEYPWDVDGLSQNPNITFDYVVNNDTRYKWNFYTMSSNLFKHHPHFKSNKKDQKIN